MEKKFEFKPFDKVLVRVTGGVWIPDFYFKMQGEEYATIAGGTLFNKCIPYNDETKHLLGTTDDYEEPYEPKKGDFVRYGGKGDYIWNIGILKENLKDGKHTEFVTYRNTIKEVEITSGMEFSDTNLRPATEEEKQMLLDAMHEKGKDWDAEKMEIVDYKWKPKYGGFYYRPTMLNAKIVAQIDRWLNTDYDMTNYIEGWVFKTEEECQAFCDKLNKAIKNVK